MHVALRAGIGIFFALHGFVHLWYVVLSQGWVSTEQTGWGGESWLLSGRVSRDCILTVASVLYGAVALGFMAGGVGFAIGAPWGTPFLVWSAVVSAATILGMWDGTAERLVEQGAIGVAIDIATVAALLV